MLECSTSLSLMTMVLTLILATMMWTIGMADRAESHRDPERSHMNQIQSREDVAPCHEDVAEHYQEDQQRMHNSAARTLNGNGNGPQQRGAEQHQPREQYQAQEERKFLLQVSFDKRE